MNHILRRCSLWCTLLLAMSIAGCSDTADFRGRLDRTQSALKGIQEAQEHEDAKERAFATLSAILKAAQESANATVSQGK